MAWSIQAGVGSTGTGNASIALPASVASGDLLILVVDLQSDTTATATGYSEIFTDTSAFDRFRVLTKTAGGSESAPTLTTAGVWAAVIVRVRDTTGAPTDITANASATTTASIDPAAAGAVKVGIVHSDPTTAGTTTWSGGATGLVEVTNASAAYLSVGYKEEAGGGALTFTTTIVGTTGTLVFAVPVAAVGAAFVPVIAAVY